MDSRWWILIVYGVVSFIFEFFKFINNCVDGNLDNVEREDLLLYKIWIKYDVVTIIGKIILTLLVVIWLPITTMVNVIWLSSVKSKTRQRKEYEIRQGRKESY